MSMDLTIKGELPVDKLMAQVAKQLADRLAEDFSAKIYADLKAHLADHLRHIDMAPLVRDAAKRVIEERLPITNFAGLGFSDFLAAAMRDYLAMRMEQEQKTKAPGAIDRLAYGGVR